ncbi:MAG: hypothetical protein U5P10_13745 [Spirochaetia bacterium]|nr:hypothetical protein [Spirochaetia bacterium]
MAASKKKPTRQEQLLEELDKLLPQIDEDGLSFLIQQTTTLIYNQKVEELNKSREVAAQNTEPDTERNSSKKEAAEKSAEVFFEAGKKQSTFFMDVQGKRAILDQEELMRMVKIAQSAENKPAAEERVYRWLKNNRDDVLFDCGIHPKDRKITAICDRLQNDFSIRED